MTPREKARKQEHTRRRHLDRLIAEGGGVCHWCQFPIRRLRKVPAESIIKRACDRLYLTTGEVVGIASVDHVVPLRDGGTFDVANLVAACTGCNRKRTEQHGELRPCRGGCGRMRANKRMCKPCQKRCRREWAKANPEKFAECVAKWEARVAAKQEHNHEDNEEKLVVEARTASLGCWGLAAFRSGSSQAAQA